MKDRILTEDEIETLLFSLDDSELEGINQKSLTPLYDEIMVGGEGPYIKDSKGKSYLDCTSQAWTMNLGFSNKDIASVVAKQATRLLHVRYGFPTIPRIKLLNKLTQLAPGDLKKVSFNNEGGGFAVEAALKLAMVHKPDAQMFLTCFGGYHGSSLATMTLSNRLAGLVRFRPWGHDRIARVPYPYCYRCPMGQEGRDACHLECLDFIAHAMEYGMTDKVAGIVLEPMQGPGGHIPAPKEFLEGLRKLCDKNDIYMIWDESQTAFGRIGYWFAAEYYNVIPDMMACTKAIAGGLPMGATFAREKFGTFTPAEEHTTFGSNPLMFASSLAYVTIVEKLNLLENVRTLGEYLTEGLEKIQRNSEVGQYIGDIRCPGFFIGVELVEDPDTKKPGNGLMQDTVEAGKERGVIFGESMPIIADNGSLFRNVLKVKPPLIVHKEHCDTILSVFEESLEEAVDYL